MNKKKKNPNIDYSSLSVAELTTELSFTKKALMNLRFLKATGELMNTSEILRAKKKQARILTQLNIKSRGD